MIAILKAVAFISVTSAKTDTNYYTSSHIKADDSDSTQNLYRKGLSNNIEFIQSVYIKREAVKKW